MTHAINSKKVSIKPHLWFDRQAVAASRLYSEAIDKSQLGDIVTLEDTPSGEVQVVDFNLGGLAFQAINGGPYFKFNPTASLMVVLETKDAVDALYQTLISDGEVLMPLQQYDFCDRYAWLADQYGLNWQLMYVPKDQQERQGTGQRPLAKVRPSLLFSGDQRGKAEEALHYYLKVFNDFGSGVTQIGEVSYSEAPTDKLINYAELTLSDLDLVIMDNAYESAMAFTEAFSLVVTCENQASIDYFWERLSSDPEAEQCGWLKDRFGLSWQIVPAQLSEYMQGPKAAVERVTQAFLLMKKFDLEALERAYRG